MKMFKAKCRTNASGEGLVIIIIIVALIGLGAWWLFSTKNTAEKEARVFGNEAIQRLAVQHDLAFLGSRLGPNAKLDLSPQLQRNLIETLTQLGVPAQPIQIDGTVTFESHFFEPKGFFTAHLNYPARPGTLDIAISHPVGRWQFDSVKLNLERAR
jgi:hypothetical protein